MSVRCFWPHCQKLVPSSRLGCKEHWFKLPKPIRDRVWETCRRQPGSIDHRGAIADAIRYAKAREEEKG